MPIVKWNVNFLLGISEIDQHRQHLVELLNDTYDEFRETTVIQPALIEELTQFAGSHFAFEEKVMREVSYPSLAAHKEEHDSFTARIAEIQKLFKEKETVSVELLWFLCNWITHHFQETDADFGRFIDVQTLHRRVRKAIHEGAAGATA